MAKNTLREETLQGFDRYRMALARAEQEKKAASAASLRAPSVSTVSSPNTEKASGERDYSPVGRLVGTAVDVSSQVSRGALGGVEGIVDAVVAMQTYMPLTLVDALTGAGTRRALRRFIEKDWVGDTSDAIADKAADLTGYDYRRASLQDGNRVGEFARNIERGVGNMLPSVAVALIPGAGPAVSLVTSGVSAGGQSMQQAYQEGAGDLQGLAYGAASGAVEAGTEKLFGGVTRFAHGKGWFDDIVPSIANKGAARAARSFVEEGTEEAISEMANPALQGIYKGKEALEAYTDPEHYKGVGEAFLAGGATALAYENTVGRVMAKSGHGHVGKEADAEALVEDIEGLARKARNAQKHYRLTPELSEKIDTQVRERYADLETVLSRVKPERRGALIEELSLGRAFDTDGRMTAEFRRRLGNAGDGTGRTLHPEFYKGDPERVRRALEVTGSVAVSDMDGLSAVERANYKEFVRMSERLDEVSGGAFDFVLVEPGESRTGAYVARDDVILVSRETLQSSERTAEALRGGWFGVTVEESLHKSNAKGGRVYEAFMHLMLKDKPAVKAATEELIRLGYIEGDYSTAKKTVDRLMHKKVENMTAEEMAQLEELYDELVAHLGRDSLSTEHFYRRLVEEDKTAAERFLDALRRLKDRKGRKSGKNAGKAEAAVDEWAMVQEEAFLAAVREAGYAVDADGKIVGVRDEEEEKIRHSFEGYAEDGKGKYRSNFPMGTPKKAKGERILHYIQDVWSKKPIPLNITDDAGNTVRTIRAQFDPFFDESENVLGDASKLMGGNRHGTASEQRVTLDLADDYYQIASEANYNYSKKETGKSSLAHQDVREWHYFVNDIYFAELGSENFEPYTVTINVKERNDGQFVYSFSAEKSNKSSTRRALHADVNRGNASANAELVGNSIPQNDPSVNPSDKKSAGVRESRKKTITNPEAFNEVLRRARIYKSEGKTVVLDMGSPLHKAIRESGKSASDVIYDLIVQHYRSVRFSDGRVAMVDNTDAKEIAKHAGPEKTAEINQLQEIIDNAVLDEADVQADHKKFASFTYYRATVQIGDQKKVILLNIGRGKFDGKDHFYAITNKKRPTAGREALSGAVADPIRSGGSNHSIPQNQEGVKGEFEKTLARDQKAIDEQDVAYLYRRKAELLEEIRANKEALSVAQIEDNWRDLKEGEKGAKERLKMIENGILAIPPDVWNDEARLQKALPDRDRYVRKMIGHWFDNPSIKYKPEIKWLSKYQDALNRLNELEKDQTSLKRRQKKLSDEIQMNDTAMQNTSDITEYQTYEEIGRQLHQNLDEIEADLIDIQDKIEDQSRDIRGMEESETGHRLIIRAEYDIRNMENVVSWDTYLRKEKGKIAIREEKIKEKLDKDHWLNKAASKAQKIKEWKSKEFLAASQIGNAEILKAIGGLSKSLVQGNISITGTRKAIRTVYEWYRQDESKKMLMASKVADSDKYEGGFYKEEIEGILKQLADLEHPDTTTPFTSIEAKELCDVLDYFKFVVEHAHTVRHKGKYVNAKEIDKVYIEKAEGREYNLRHYRGMRSHVEEYGINFSDPASVMRFFDGYVEGGFLTDMYEAFRRANTDTDYIKHGMVEQVRAFEKKHKGYFDEADKKTVTVSGQTKVPLMVGLYLYEALGREQAIPHLMANGYKYFGADGAKMEAPGFMPEYGKDTTKADMQPIIDQVRGEIMSQLTDADKAFLQVVEKLFNDDCKTYKRETDMKLYGYSTVIEGLYVPIRIAEKAVHVDTADYRSEMDRATNASFNKTVTKGAKNTIMAESLIDVLMRHVDGISRYAGMSETIIAYEVLLSVDVGDNPGNPKTVKMVYDKIWGKYKGKDNHEHGGHIEFFKDMVNDMQGIPVGKAPTTAERIFDWMRGKYAVAVLGLNPKVMATQFSSLIASTSILDPKYVMKGLPMTADTAALDEFCHLAMLRNADNTAVRAQSVTDKLSNIGEKMTALIGKTDRLVVTRLWNACLLQSADEHHLAVDSVENKAKAGELLARVIYETQQNAQATEKSAAMRGNTFNKMFTMFTSDAMKMTGRVLDGIGEYRATRKNKEFPHLYDEARHRAAKVKLTKALGALGMQALYMALVATVFRKLLARDDEDTLKDWSVEDIGRGAGDLFSSLLGGLPLISDAVSFFMDGYDMEDMGVSAVNDLLRAVRNFTGILPALVSGDITGEEAATKVRLLFYALGNTMGIPLQNIYKYLRGAIYHVGDGGERLVYRIDSIFKVPSFSADIGRAIEAEDEDRVAFLTGLALDERVSLAKNSAVRKELVRLTNAGEDILPRSVGTSVVYDGEEYAMTLNQQKRFREVYEGANEAVLRLVQSSYYADVSDTVKAKAVARIYKLYYNLAIEDLLGVEMEQRVQLYAKAIPPEKLAIIIAEAGEIKADLTAEGKPVTGSRRKKIADYVSRLRLSAAQKYLVFAYLGYKTANGHEEVERYVKGLQISRAGKEELMEDCGVEY